MPLKLTLVAELNSPNIWDEKFVNLSLQLAMTNKKHTKRTKKQSA